MRIEVQYPRIKREGSEVNIGTGFIRVFKDGGQRYRFHDSLRSAIPLAAGPGLIATLSHDRRYIQLRYVRDVPDPEGVVRAMAQAVQDMICPTSYRNQPSAAVTPREA